MDFEIYWYRLFVYSVVFKKLIFKIISHIIKYIPKEMYNCMNSRRGKDMYNCTTERYHKSCISPTWGTFFSHCWTEAARGSCLVQERWVWQEYRWWQEEVSAVELENCSGRGVLHRWQAGHCVLAGGDPAVRLRLVDRLSSRGLQVLDAGQHLGSEVRALSGGMLGAGS